MTDTPQILVLLRERREMLRGRIPDRPAPAAPSNLIELCHQFSAEVTRSLRELLETKHLYQRVKVSYENLNAANKDSPAFRAIAESTWEPLSERSTWTPEDVKDIQDLHFRVPHVKLYCGTCESTEAFNPVGEGSAMYGSPWRMHAEDLTEVGWVQTFAFPFLCQSCRGAPEVLLVRRECLTLILCGRSPIETVVVPSEIPKNVRKFYSGALVAYQSGQSLAGNFMLRTLIEQFARSASGAAATKADEVLDQYMATLPATFKEQFRSMKELYGKLSADIHGAIGDAATFEESRAAIVKHFQARQLFDLP